GALIFLSFIMTLTLIREKVQKPEDTVAKTGVSWSQLHARTVVICMLCTGLLLMLANMSIEPIITVYVRTLVSEASQITKVAG
ncbi:MFS transporter, partial [Klebsiella pneumoniae]|nr:MFS transporter [Klebsiella pneumoniae]